MDNPVARCLALLIDLGGSSNKEEDMQRNPRYIRRMGDGLGENAYKQGNPANDGFVKVILQGHSCLDCTLRSAVELSGSGASVYVV